MASFAPGMALATIVAPEKKKYTEYNAYVAQSEEQKEAGYTPKFYGADYLCEFLNPVTLKYKTELAVKVLNGFGPFAKLEFDAIAFSGQSGSLIAPIVAMLMGKSLIMVRKSGVRSHSSYKVEGDINAKSYIIIDDLTSSGKTIEFIQTSMRDEGFKHCKYVGMLGVLRLSDEAIDREVQKYVIGGPPAHYPLQHTPEMQEEALRMRERRREREDEIEREAKAETERLNALREERKAQGIVEPVVEEPTEPTGNFWGLPSSRSQFLWSGLGFTTDLITGPPPNGVIRIRTRPPWDGNEVNPQAQPDSQVTTVDTNFDPVPA